MKIGIDIRTLMDAHYSGVPEYTLNLLKEIFRLDKRNQYKLFYNSGRDVSSRMPQFAQANVEIVRTGYPNKLFNNIMQNIVKAPKLDQLLGVDLFFMPNIGFIALSPECRKIITIHDLSFLRYPEFYSLKRRWWHVLINARRLLKEFDHIVAISENTKKDIIELGEVPAGKVKIIYSGIDKRCQPMADTDERLLAVREKYNLPNKFILFLGTLEPRKNVSGVIKAFDLFMKNNSDGVDYYLVIAGANGWKSREIFRTWKNSERRERIKMLGYVDQVEKVSLYNLASVFVYPSFYEGFGFPPLEAMACGTPVIASSAASLPEVAGEAAIMVDPYKVSELARSLEQVIASQELRAELTVKSLIAAKRFSWEKAARSYLELFK